MGVQVEKTRSQGKAGQFENLLPRLSPEIRSDFRASILKSKDRLSELAGLSVPRMTGSFCWRNFSRAKGFRPNQAWLVGQ